jgi:hypothetical protein
LCLPFHSTSFEQFFHISSLSVQITTNMTVLFSLTAAIAIALQVSQISAVPNVTVVPLGPGSCVYWPNWQGSGGDRIDISGGLRILVDQSDDDGVNGLTLEQKTFNWTYGPVRALVADLRKSSRLGAKSWFRCVNGALEYPQGDKFNVGKDQRNGFLRIGEGYTPEVYAHEVNGVRQPGVFLGVKNQTKWGFNYRGPEACGELDYYEVKLQDLPLDPAVEPRAGYNPEFFGFLKVEAI